MALFSPNASGHIYGHERLDGHSVFDPFAPDWGAFPQARRAETHAAVLRPGDTLVVPCGWWLAWRALAPSLLLQRTWVSEAKAGAKEAVKVRLGPPGLSLTTALSTSHLAARCCRRPARRGATRGGRRRDEARAGARG